jgi:hypothetical protein
MQWLFMQLLKEKPNDEKKGKMETKKNLKTCKNGHQFFKSSACLTFPICEEERKLKDNFLSLLGAPERRALENNGITTLEQLAKYSEKEVLNFHGMGKSTIPKLEKLLSDKNLAFNSNSILIEKNMAKEIINLNPEVTDFLKELNHPFIKEIEQPINCILSVDKNLTENIKWNGPNYCFNKEDRITMRIQPPTKQAQLIFHRGAKRQMQPQDKLISDKSKMLVWKENDRAIITFKSLHDIENGKTELISIINEWIKAGK